MTDAAPSRRTVLAAAAALALSAAGCSGSVDTGRSDPATGSDRPGPTPAATPPGPAPTGAVPALTTLEQRTGRRIGVWAVDARTGATVAHRADERFPMCSTFKTLAVAAVLANDRANDDGAALRERIRYTRADLLDHSPITSQHLDGGLTIEQLCAAAMQHSDNTAANLLLEHVGGPSRVTAFVRRLGDARTRLDRSEPALNAAVPGDVRDTTTPQLIARDYLRLATGTTLDPRARSLLVHWLRTNTTGAGQIRAAVPSTWIVGDRTGSGDYGTSNDVAIVWPPHAPSIAAPSIAPSIAAPPIALAVLTTTRDRRLDPDPHVVADAARVVVRAITR